MDSGGNAYGTVVLGLLSATLTLLPVTVLGLFLVALIAGAVVALVLWRM